MFSVVFFGIGVAVCLAAPPIGGGMIFNIDDKFTQPMRPNLFCIKCIGIIACKIEKSGTCFVVCKKKIVKKKMTLSQMHTRHEDGNNFISYGKRILNV